MLLGQNRHVVGADLVGEIAVGGNAVRAYHYGLNLAGAHEAGCHVVADHRRGNAIGHQLPSGQPRALQKRTRLVGVDVNLLAHLDSRANHAQRRAIAACGQSSGIAVGQHTTFVRQQFAAECSQSLARSNVFFVHGVCFCEDSLLNLGHCRSGRVQLRKQALHAVDGPEQVHRRRSRSGQARADCLEFRRKGLRCCRSRALRSQRHAVSR